MFALLKPDGKLIIGPIRQLRLGLLSPYRYKGTTFYSSRENAEAATAEIIRRTKLWWPARMIQLFSNKHGVHIGTYFVGGTSK